MFGIDQVPIHNDVEDSAAALDQFRLDTRRFLNRVRQTGGLRGVVSLHAVSNADLHSLPSPFIGSCLLRLLETETATA